MLADGVRDFDFDLPADLIAQEPAADAERVAAARTWIARPARIAHGRFAALPDLLAPGDLLVVNNTRVFPARLLGRRVPSGGAVECLLLDAPSGARQSRAGNERTGRRWCTPGRS